MMIGTDSVVTQPFFSRNGASGIIDFFPGDHLLALGAGEEPGWWRVLLSRGSRRTSIVFFARSALATFVRPGRQV